MRKYELLAHVKGTYGKKHPSQVMILGVGTLDRKKDYAPIPFKHEQ